MPVYEFRCSECDFEFEKIAKVGKNTTKCPKCSSPNTTKLISAPANSNNKSCKQGCGNCSCG